jgi:hypothetical protein
MSEVKTKSKSKRKQLFDIDAEAKKHYPSHDYRDVHEKYCSSKNQNKCTKLMRRNSLYEFTYFNHPTRSQHPQKTLNLKF